MVWARVKGGQVLVVVVAVPNALARWSGRVTCASALLPPRRRVCSHSLVCCRQQQPPSPLLKGRTQGGGRWWRRGLSSDSSIRNTHQEEANKFRPVKTMLNRLYLIVHPDLFADRPKEQEVNGKSLQSLMAFLDEIRASSAPAAGPQALAAPHSVSFYLLPTAAAADGREEPTKEEPSSSSMPRSSLAEKPKTPHIAPLKHISAVLHASLNASVLGKEDSLRQQFTALFRKCGVMDDDEVLDFAGFLTGDGDKDENRDARSRHQGGLPTISQVVDFLMAHHSTILRKQEDYRIVEREVGMHRYILMSMQRGLRVNFGRREMNDSRLQLRLLKPFLKVVENLNAAGKDLSNCTVCFSAGVSAPVGQSQQKRHNPNTYDDAFGRIFLNSLDPPDVWYNVLHAIDMDLVSARQHRMKETKRMESEIAERLGFKLLCADYSKIDPEEYVRFLDRVRSETDGLTEAKEDLHKSIAIIVKNPEARLTVDPAGGVLSVPTATSAQDLINWAKSEGAKAAHQHAFVSGLRERETQLRILTKRRLRLLSLEPDDTISTEGMTELCFTLRKYANTLAPLVQRMSVIASNRLEVSECGDLRMPWNFT